MSLRDCPWIDPKAAGIYVAGAVLAFIGIAALLLWLFETHQVGHSVTVFTLVCVSAIYSSVTAYAGVTTDICKSVKYKEEHESAYEKAKRSVMENS